MQKKVGNKLFSLGICLGAIIFFILGAVFSSASEKVDYFDKSGKQVAGVVGRMITVDFSDRSYTVLIDGIQGDYVTVYVSGEGPTMIRDHDTALFDRAKDGTAVTIEVLSINGNYTNLRLRRVEGITPVEPVVESPSYIVENMVQPESGQIQQETAKTVPTLTNTHKMIIGVLGVVAFVVVVFLAWRLMNRKSKRRSRPVARKIVLKKAKRKANRRK